MDSKTALEQVAYMQSLVEENRIRAAYGYPHFLWWGGIWLVAFLLEAYYRNGMAWSILAPIGFVGTFGMMLYRRRKRSHTLPAMAKRMLYLNLSLLILCIGIISLMPQIELDYALGISYYIFWVGMIYVINGIFSDRVIVCLGMVIVMLSLLPQVFVIGTALFIILALVGGGGLILVGVYFRRVVYGIASQASK